jgi:ATP-binding cassette subfamily F protein 3
MYSGNISYYLDKTSGSSEPKSVSSSTHSAKSAAVSRKDQRRVEAAAREARNKLLKPLEKELEVLESKIAEYEAAQGTLTTALSDPEIAANPERFREASQAVAVITTKLEHSYSRWGDLSDEIEKVKQKLDGSV